MKYLLPLIFLYILITVQLACVHESILPDDMVMDPIDTLEMDTLDLEPCDPDVVYFEKEVLPILRSNCALSGCHDSDSAQDGVILESYKSVVGTADVEPFDLTHSEIYTVLIDDDEDQRMPPPPNIRLNPIQIDLIAQWILQGAQDLNCDNSNDPCPIESVSYANDIFPIISMNCLGCHSGGNPSAGLDYTKFNVVQAVALNGRLFGSVSWSPGFTPMPFNQGKLAACDLLKIEAWIISGAPNN